MSAEIKSRIEKPRVASVKIQNVFKRKDMKEFKLVSISWNVENLQMNRTNQQPELLTTSKERTYATKFQEDVGSHSKS